MVKKNLIINKSNVQNFGNIDVRISPSTEYSESKIEKLYNVLNIAENLNLDLVVVNSSTNPVIVKIIDFKKFLYNQKKQEKEQAKKNRANVQKIKEVKFHLNIGKNDFDYKINHTKQFISENCKVRIEIFLRGREIEMKEMINELVNKIISETSEFATFDKISTNGNVVSFFLTKNKEKKK